MACASAYAHCRYTASSGHRFISVFDWNAVGSLVGGATGTLSQWMGHVGKKAGEPLPVGSHRFAHHAGHLATPICERTHANETCWHGYDFISERECELQGLVWVNSGRECRVDLDGDTAKTQVKCSSLGFKHAAAGRIADAHVRE